MGLGKSQRRMIVSQHLCVPAVSQMLSREVQHTQTRVINPSDALCVDLDMRWCGGGSHADKGSFSLSMSNQRVVTTSPPAEDGP